MNHGSVPMHHRPMPDNRDALDGLCHFCPSVFPFICLCIVSFIIMRVSDVTWQHHEPSVTLATALLHFGHICVSICMLCTIIITSKCIYKYVQGFWLGTTYHFSHVWNCNVLYMFTVYFSVARLLIPCFSFGFQNLFHIECFDSCGSSVVHFIVLQNIANIFSL